MFNSNCCYENRIMSFFQVFIFHFSCMEFSCMDIREGLRFRCAPHRFRGTIHSPESVTCGWLGREVFFASEMNLSVEISENIFST
jgi:hypothetical protein